MEVRDIEYFAVVAKHKSIVRAAEALGLSQPAAWRRIKALHDSGAISGRRVVVDAGALGFGVTVFLGVKLAA